MTADLARQTGDRPPGLARLRGLGDWRPWLGVLLSAGLLAAVLAQLGSASSEALHLLVTLPPAVWAAFVLLYLTQPFADLVIFRRLWRLPVSGLLTLMRKVVLNEIVFGYSGEAYFYMWARKRAGLTSAPFAAIKDVNLLSALLGNGFTLLMLLVSAADIAALNLPHVLGTALWWGLPVAGVSLVIVVFAPRVFSLRRDQLLFVGAIHAVRLLISSGLTLLVWRLALPDVPLADWVLLLALRLLVARIPFLANKDLVFSNLILLVVGARSPVALLLAALALATLVVHLAVIGLTGGGDLFRSMRTRS